MTGIKSESGFDAFSFLGTLVMAFVAMSVINMALDSAGLNPASSLSGMPGLIGFLAVGGIGLLAFNFIGTFILSFLKRIGNALGESLARLLNGLDALAHNLAALACAGLTRLLALSLLPFTWSWGLFYAWAIAPKLERFRQWRELRALYAQVRDQYQSFEDFQRAFEGGQQQDEKVQEEIAPEEDQYTKACRVLGLADGSFTQAQFKVRYRELMKQAHPDANGSAELAAELNQARDLIKSRKGWK